MKVIEWDEEKNQKLKAERGISFEDALLHIMEGDLLDVIEHPNRERYPNQRIFVIRIEDSGVQNRCIFLIQVRYFKQLGYQWLSF